MFERYTEKARRAVFFARYEASQRCGAQIEADHLLLGVLLEDAPLAHLLALSAAQLETIRTLVRKGSEGGTSTSTSVDLPMTDGAQRALKYAAEEADALKHPHIGPEHLLLGLLREETAPAAAILREYGIGSERLRKVAIQRAAGHPVMKQPQAPKRQRFRDLVEAAANDESGPLVGRERELEWLIHSLSRRTKNNAVLIGEAGVGKTAIVEGLAERIAQGDAPSFLAQRRLLALDTSSLLIPGRPDASRGEFEDVLADVPDPANTILFIRGLFNLATAGSAWTVVEAMHALEPQLVRNGMRCIATGSAAGLRATVERAGALARHFEVIDVAPAGEEEAVRILMGLKPKFERFHDVVFGEGAIETAVGLSGRFLPGRQLPDRAIDLIDDAAVAVKLRRESGPREVAEARKRIQQHVRVKDIAIANHEFDAALRYSDEERKEREDLDRLQEQHKGEAGGQGTVTSEDIAAVVAGRAAGAVTAGEWEQTADELAAILPAEVKEWVPLLAAYLVRCSAAQAEALTRAITSAKAKLSGKSPAGSSR